MWPSTTHPSFSTPPHTPEQQTLLVDLLQDAKTRAYISLSKTSTTRPGVLSLLDSALANPNIKVGICSAATKEGFLPLVQGLLGQSRLDALDVLIVGDDVPKKKPDPLIYTTASTRLGLDRSKCVVIEDSMVGLRAAVGAGMKCIITYTTSTVNEPFYAEGAAAKVPNLGGVVLDDIFGPLSRGGAVLETKKDRADGVKAAKVKEVSAAYLGWTPHYMLQKM